MQAQIRADRWRVEAAEQGWRPLGELLLAKGLVSQEELDRALIEQADTGRLLGAILVQRGFVSGPAVAIALAEQYGVVLSSERGFGSGLWAEIGRRAPPEENVFKFEPVPQPQLEAVPDLDPELDRLQAENRRLQQEVERLRSEFTKLRLVAAPEQPSSHLVFIPTPERYVLLERQGPPPSPGDELELSEGSFVVGKLGRAPVPGEHRPCAFLLVR